MLKNLPIRAKLGMGFGAIITIILCLLALAYNNFVRMSKANEWDKHTMEVMLEAERISSSVFAIQAVVRGYLLTGTPGDLVTLPELESAMHKHIVKATELTADSPERQKRFKRIAVLSDDWVKNQIRGLVEQRGMSGKQPGGAEQAAVSPDLKRALQTSVQIAQLNEAASEEEERLLVARSQTSSALQRAMLLVLTVGGALCIGLALVVSAWLARSLLAPLNILTNAVTRISQGDQSARAEVISSDEMGQVAAAFNRMAQAIQESLGKEVAAASLLKSKVDALLVVVSRATVGDLTGQVSVTGSDAIGQLGDGLAKMLANLRALIDNVQKAGIQVTTSATEIAASARQLQATGVEHAQTSLEVLSTTKEISANTTHLLNTMEDAAAVADFTTNATAQAKVDLTRMDGTMQDIVAATDTINSKLAALSEKASNINSVLVTITKVADQTNLLSLNAAIEAEKAGEAGRGFSVVASEIRRLADQTSVSTWDIEQMLKEMQSAVSASVMGMDKFSEEVRRSVTEVRRVSLQLSRVMEEVQKLVPQFDMVLQGMQSQSVGATQISDTMSQLNDASQQSVESLQVASQAVQQLQRAASGLHAGVASFTLSTKQ